MLTEERHDRIVNLLRVQGSATVTELAQMLDTSESTIRRDLTSLDRMGRLKKVHGGATAVSEQISINEPDFDTKAALNVAEKAAIGRTAAGYIQNTDFVFIDAGTTTAALIDYIPSGVKATFVTNGIVQARALIRRGLKTYILGGLIKPGTEAVVGSDSIANIKNYNFTKAFIGTNGINLSEGFTTPDIEEARLKTEAIRNSFVTYILADSSKFDIMSAVTFAELKQCCIITDELKNPEYREHTVVKEVMV